MVDRRIHGDTAKSRNQKQKEILLERGAVTTWAVSMDALKKVIKSLTPKYKSFKGFRFFRLRQIGLNSSGNFVLANSGIEVYGSAYANWKAKTKIKKK